jgi:acetyl-CoA carboxylase beta subunit
MTTMAEFKASSNTEDEYFAREDAEKKRKLAQEVKKETEVAEQARLKALHWMRCPKCGMQMHEVRMRGVDVDVCFSCNGVFLDQGELEHIEKPESKGVMSAILNWFR